MNAARQTALVAGDPPAIAGTSMAAPKALLLMRQTPAQMFCANWLFHRGVIDRVYIEQGSTWEPAGWGLLGRLWRHGPVGIWQRVIRDLQVFDNHPMRVLDYYAVRLATHKLVGRQRWHEERLLGPSCRGLDPGLGVVRGSSVNDASCRQLVLEGGYRLVFVFGTGLLREGLLELPGTTFVNLHHGWLPKFRGEGILSALAEEGIEGLGVTVHLVDCGVDTGPVLYRERLTVEPWDNAYAVVLKATLRGASLFQAVYEDARQGPLRAEPQDPSAGRVYSARMIKRSYRLRLAAAKSLRDANPDRAPLVGVKRLAAQAVACGGLTMLSQRRHGCRLRILMYHGVMPRLAGPAAFGNLFMDVEQFSRHLRYLTRHFTVLSLDDVLAYAAAGRPFPERATMVTFDDGYRETLRTIVPLLREHRVPVTAFVPADDIEQGSCSWFDILRVLVDDSVRDKVALRLGDELVIDGRAVYYPERTFMVLSRRLAAMPPDRLCQLMPAVLEAGQRARVLERYPEFALAGWAQWREAAATQLVAVGSHGLTHRNLARVSRDEQEREAQESKYLIERELGGRCRAFAYPYGAWNRGAAEAVRSAGYLCAVTTDEGLNAAGHPLFELCRTMIGDKGDFAMFCARVSGVWDRGGLRDT